MPVVGVIKPSTRPGRAEDLVAILPPEIELEHANCAIDNGTLQELENSFKDFERNIEIMADLKVDLIHTAGVPFMLLGREGEARLIESWQRHGIAVFTNSMAQVAALEAFGVQRIVSASYFPPESNLVFARYLEDAGFTVLDNGWVDTDFKSVPKLKAETLRTFFDALWAPHAKEAEALYLIGPAWRESLFMIEDLEAAYGVPVIHHIPAQSWEMQRRFGLSVPVTGYGRLVREMPG